jgi:hypothetical protein
MPMLSAAGVLIVASARQIAAGLSIPSRRAMRHAVNGMVAKASVCTATSVIGCGKIAKTGASRKTMGSA